MQVKEAKEERAEVARTHIDKVTKGKVNVIRGNNTPSIESVGICIH